jgi:NifU-like protein involved in Fe-S cluster formation
MKRLVPLVAAALALSACGLDTASSAATAAALKKQELEQAKKTQDQFQQKIGQSMEQLQQSQQTRDEASRQ